MPPRCLPNLVPSGEPRLVDHDGEDLHRPDLPLKTHEAPIDPLAHSIAKRQKAHGNRHATVDIVESVVRNNESSVFGGGISNYGELRLRTEVTENKLPAGGGGVTSAGGGIYNARRLTVDDSTIAGNFATAAEA